MENTFQTNRLNKKDINFNLINETIEKTLTFIKENDYQIKDSAGLSEIIESNFNAALSNLSLKKRKKLATAIWTVSNHPTLKKVNLFFHFLMKEVMKSDSRVRVIKSAKELAIIEKRKAYTDALAKVKAAYADYKEEKGDFYKLRLSKNQEVA